MTPLQEAIKETILEDIKSLPRVMTPDDIYNYVNEKNGQERLGKNKIYEYLLNEHNPVIPHKRCGRKIYIARTDFIKWVYGEEEKV